MSHAHLSAEKLEKLSEDPQNKVLRWAQPGDRRQDALGAEQILSLMNALANRVVSFKKSRPDANEFMVRYELSQEAPEIAVSTIPRWSVFAEHYPTFWGKITSASSTRRDMITIHMMIDARLDLEKGVLGSEEEVEARIQSDLLALNAKKVEIPSSTRVPASELLQKAKLRRKWLEKRFADVLVPTEELRKAGISFEPTQCILDDITAMHEKLAKKLATPEGKSARLHEISQVPPAIMLFGRNMLEFRAKIAKKCMGLPEPLDAKGHNFMPTYSRSAQLDLQWQDVWV